MKDKTRKQKAFMMRMEKKSIEVIAKELKASVNTISKWENGWVDSKGRRHKGWKEELQRLWQEQEDKELECGLMLKNERIKTYDKLARLTVEKIEKNFPEITAKSVSDVKALMSEVRELCRLIAIEKGEYSTGNNTMVAVKTDITLTELQRRYKDAEHNSEDDTNA